MTERERAAAEKMATGGWWFRPLAPKSGQPAAPKQCVTPGAFACRMADALSELEDRDRYTALMQANDDTMLRLPEDLKLTVFKIDKALCEKKGWERYFSE